MILTESNNFNNSIQFCYGNVGPNEDVIDILNTVIIYQHKILTSNLPKQYFKCAVLKLFGQINCQFTTFRKKLTLTLMR